MLVVILYSEFERLAQLFRIESASSKFAAEKNGENRKDFNYNAKVCARKNPNITIVGNLKKEETTVTKKKGGPKYPANIAIVAKIARLLLQFRLKGAQARITNVAFIY